MDKQDCLLNFELAIEACLKTPVILVNEFDMLTAENRADEFDLDFYNTLRVLAEQGRMVLILIAKDPIRELCKSVLGMSSPFYNIFESINLIQFEEQEADGFLEYHHQTGILSAKSIRYVKRHIQDYRHPLILQISCDTLFHSKEQNKSPSRRLRLIIHSRVEQFLNHDEVEKARAMSKRNNDPKLGRTLDLVVSIALPTISIVSIVAVLSVALREQSAFASVIIVLATIFFTALIIIFAGRFTNIIGESTFFKLFSRIIDELPIFSRISEIFTSLQDKNVKQDSEEENSQE